MFYDLKKHTRTYNLPVGTMGFISYERLAKALRDSGELKEGEDLTHFHIGNDGIQYRTEHHEKV